MAINLALDETDKAIVALDFPYTPANDDVKPTLTMVDDKTRIAIPDAVKDQVFTIVREAYKASKQELIAKAQSIIK